MNNELLLEIQLNLFTAALLAVFFVALLVKKEFISFSGRMMRNLSILAFSLLIIEALSYVADGVDTKFAIFVNTFTNSLLFIFTPLLASLGVSYLDYKIHNKINRIRKKLYYLHPFFVVLPLSIINIFTPILFSIGPGNVYERGPVMIINIIVLYTTLFYGIYMIYQHRKNIDKNLIYGLFTFMFIPAIGGALQMLYFGLSTLYASVGVAVIATYIIVETVGTTKDYLTKLFNKIKAYEYIEVLQNRNTPFSVIMIDLEDFKKLNDTQGHLNGDIALMQFARILRTVFDKNALTSRFGGDEFLIVYEETKTPVIESKKSLINYLISYSEDKIVQEVKFSFGYSIFQENDGVSAETLIVQADNNMFVDKAENKNYKRRKTDKKGMR